MGWFRRLFSRRRRNEPEQGGIGETELVSGLKEDHRELLSLYGQIATAAQHGPYDGIPDQLGTLRFRLESHLRRENYRLYGFLEDRLSTDRDKARLIQDFRREMGTIAKQALRFIRHWQEHGVDDASAARFREELEGVGVILAERIKREERDLYPLYENTLG